MTKLPTDIKLWLRKEIDEIDLQIKVLQETLINKSELYYDLLMPGYTHLQVAQPVTFGHHLLAYVEMLGRDRSRLIDCRKRLNRITSRISSIGRNKLPH